MVTCFGEKAANFGRDDLSYPSGGAQPVPGVFHPLLSPQPHGFMSQHHAEIKRAVLYGIILPTGCAPASSVIPLFCRVTERSYLAFGVFCGFFWSFFGSTDSEKSTKCFQQDNTAGEHQTTSKGWHGTLLRAARGTSPVNSAFQGFPLRLGEGKGRGGNAGEGGINLLELLCKVQFEALGVLV